MDYYLDTEFDSSTNELISCALISEENVPLYMIFACRPQDPWVIEHVVPFIKDVPVMTHFCATHHIATDLLNDYFKHDANPHVVSDWPTDFIYFCELLTDGKGGMIDIAGLTMEVVRADAWPNEIPNAIQHNAYWDAFALKHMIEGAPEGAGESEEGQAALG